MLSWVKILVPVFILMITACGFSPLYGTDANQSKITNGFDQIYIDNIANREGQYLRNALIDRFYTQGRPEQARYRLAVEPIKETRTDLDITKSSDATRAQMRLNTAIILSERSSGREVLKRKLVSITSYNVLQSIFTTHVSEDNARENALDDLARQIEQQLALYFSRQP